MQEIDGSSLIGTVSEPVVYQIERGAIRQFAAAIGDAHPDYEDGTVAPPTFPTTFRSPIPGLAGVDPARTLHAGEEYIYERPLRAGDAITCQRRIVDVYKREGRLGPMTFVVVEMEGRDQTGALVLRRVTTLIVR